MCSFILEAWAAGVRQSWQQSFSIGRAAIFCRRTCTPKVSEPALAIILISGPPPQIVESRWACMTCIGTHILVCPVHRDSERANCSVVLVSLICEGTLSMHYTCSIGWFKSQMILSDHYRCQAQLASMPSIRSQLHGIPAMESMAWDAVCANILTLYFRCALSKFMLQGCFGHVHLQDAAKYSLSIQLDYIGHLCIGAHCWHR